VDLVIVSLVSGVSLGGTFALIALGLVFAFRATGTFNFAHGELMLLAAFLVGKWQATHFGSFGVDFLLSVVVTAAVAAAFYLVVLRRTVGLPHWMGLIATLGLASCLDGLLAAVFGSNQYNIAFPGLPTGTVRILDARVSSTSLTVAGGTLLLALLLTVAVRFTRVGIQIRAAGQDALLASQGGINIRTVYTCSWALAGLLAALAGVTYGSTNIVNSDLENVALLAFPAMLLGGLDSIEGAVVGGLIIGVTQGFVATFWGGQYVDVVTYTALLVVLLVRPSGLFGTKQAARV
jgi:branched-chain amino acid transport system permease protein